MPQARVMRIVSFRPGDAESAADAALRDDVLPRLVDLDSIVDVWVGRHGSRDDRARALASTWATDPADGPDGPADVAALRALGERLAVVTAVEELPIAVHARFDRAEPMRILRVFHGQVRPGELDAYVEAARAGMLADAAVDEGLIAFVLGTSPPDRVTTISAWTSWSKIEAATGGNIHQPFATRNADRLASFTVSHFEVLPDAGERARQPG